MRIFRHFTGLKDEDRGAVVAIGNFDGVHCGHRAVVDAEIPSLSASEDEDFEQLEALLSRASLVIDGLLGTGLRPRERPVEGAAAEILRRLRAAREAPPPVQIVALDLPSGVDADTGYADPLTVACDVTVTFGFAKVGLFAGAGRRLAGRVVPVEIGLPAGAADALTVEELRLRDLKAAMPERGDDAHKGTFGTAIIAAGSRRYPGAARLAAEAAARSGALGPGSEGLQKIRVVLNESHLARAWYEGAV